MSFCDEHGTADYCGECVYGPEIERLTAERDAAQAEVRELRAELARVSARADRYGATLRVILKRGHDHISTSRLQMLAQWNYRNASEVVQMLEADRDALSQPAAEHEFPPDHVCTDSHCDECGEFEAECECEQPAERESLPLMARREWMGDGTDYFVVHGDFCLEVESFRGKAPHYEADGLLIVIGDSAVCDQVDAEAQPDGVYRIADTDEHGFKVIPRTADMPKRAKYRLTWIMQADAAGGEVEYTDSLPLALEANRSGAVSERIEDYRESGQEGQGDD